MGAWGTGLYSNDTAEDARTDFSVFELDEVYWYIKRKTGHETRANTYIMTMMSRTPRQIEMLS